MNVTDVIYVLSIAVPELQLNSRCSADDVCADVNAACTFTCLCNTGFYERHGVCGKCLSYSSLSLCLSFYTVYLCRRRLFQRKTNMRHSVNNDVIENV